MAHDRAWRNLASRPISPLNVMTKAWPGAKGALTPDASSASPEAAGIPEPNRDRATLPAAMMVMIAVNFGAVLGLVGWPVLQAFGAGQQTGRRGGAAEPGRADVPARCHGCET